MGKFIGVVACIGAAICVGYYMLANMTADMYYNENARAVDSFCYNYTQDTQACICTFKATMIMRNTYDRDMMIRAVKSGDLRSYASIAVKYYQSSREFREYQLNCKRGF